MNIILDVTHTSHCYAHTGIQQVVRSMYDALSSSNDVQPVCYDPYFEAWRDLDSQETKLMAPSIKNPSIGRKAIWTIKQKARGKYRKFVSGNVKKELSFNSDTILVAPEVFDAKIFQNYTHFFNNILGPKIAIFHDAVALQMPELSPKNTVAKLESYVKNLAAFDGIVAISQTSADVLKALWQDIGISDQPPIAPIQLGVGTKNVISNTKVTQQNDVPKVLCVSAIEGRKNQKTLLEAAKILWEEGAQFELTFIGLPNRETGMQALSLMHKMRLEGYSVFWKKTVSEDELHAFYKEASFTVYPSLAEGFGLPIVESLQWEKPCICSRDGAMGEVAQEGGALLCDVSSSVALATAMKTMLSDERTYVRLKNESRRRKFKTWLQYAEELKAFANDLQKKNTDMVAC